MEDDIEDTRRMNEFKSTTYSGLKKTIAKTDLLKCIREKNVVESFTLVADLISAGHYAEIWDCFIMYITKYVHVEYLTIACAVEHNINQFKVIINKAEYDYDILELRNNGEVRRIFYETVAMLCNAKERIPMSIPKELYTIASMTTKFKAPNTSYCSTFTMDDPIELFPLLNEFAYALTIKNSLMAIYWMDAVFDFESKYNDVNRSKLVCSPRDLVDGLECVEPVWFVWEVLLKECNNPIVQSLLQLFAFKFSSTKKRKGLLYLAISVLCDNAVFYKGDKITINHSLIQTVFMELKKKCS